MIEIDALEHELQRANIALVKLVAREDIEGRHALRRQAVTDKSVKLLRHQMKRNVAAGEGIDHDEVVGLAVAVQEHAGVALVQTRPARLTNAEIFLGDVDD